MLYKGFVMSELREKLKEPLVEVSREQESLLNSIVEQMEEFKELKQHWPSRKKKLQTGIIKPLVKLAEALKKLSQPLKLKAFNKEKKKMQRSRYMALYSGGGFRLKFGIFWLQTLNIIRILLILAFYFTILLFIGIGALKLFEMIRGG